MVTVKHGGFGLLCYLKAWMPLIAGRKPFTHIVHNRESPLANILQDLYWIICLIIKLFM